MLKLNRETLYNKSEVCQRVGCSARTLSNYMRHGFVRPRKLRQWPGHPRPHFTEEDIRRLTVIYQTSWEIDQKPRQRTGQFRSRA